MHMPGNASSFWWILPETAALLILFMGESSGKSSINEYWSEWWTHDGISGPDYWGKFNKEWEVCSKGQFQSPVDIRADKLLFDPNLPQLHIDKHKVAGVFENIGHGMRFNAANSTAKNAPVNISFIGEKNAGYTYRFEEVRIHFGSSESRGSEHTINSKAFPGEVQIYAYNSILYNNFSHAENMAHGLLAIAIFLQIGEMTNPELAHLVSKSENVKYKGKTIDIQDFSVRDLIPETDAYVTYPGSLTEPPCQENIHWIIMNKPIYITKNQLYALRKIRRGDGAASRLMENNYRATMPFGHHRTFRTNIELTYSKGEKCPSMYQNFIYQAKEWDIV